VSGLGGHRGNGILAEGLEKAFKKGPKAVDGLHFEVSPGEIYGFLGPNGAGKSTTVHMLTTLLPPDGGRATVAGFDVVKQGAKVRSLIGAALQEAALDPLLTGREHVKLQATLQGIPRAERQARGEELLARVGLTAAADRKVGGYSGGMKRRLDLALALIHRPTVLFLDEPTTGLDPQSRADLWDEVNRLAREEGVTVFLTTQYLEEADALADRVAIINHGRLVAEGTPAALKAEIGRPTLEIVPSNGTTGSAISAVLDKFGETVESGKPDVVAARLDTGAEALADIIRTLDAQGLTIEAFELHQPTLDDVFLAKTGESMSDADEPAATGAPA
jgi:ABC-2 type transport system ATP-binding protein